MFDRLQKPFLTVETGEAYQPVRLTYEVYQPELLVSALESLGCISKNAGPHSWSWYWQDECDSLAFASIDAFKRNLEHPARLASLHLQENQLYITLRSFKRACLAAPFFHRFIDSKIARIHHADFINKVFATDERLPHGFSEIFSEPELEKILKQRLLDYENVQAQCEQAESPEEALALLSEYSQREGGKRLPYAERYLFDLPASAPSAQVSADPDVIFLGFYVYLRGRELVAIKRWFGETGYTLANAADDTVESVFGNMA